MAQSSRRKRRVIRWAVLIVIVVVVLLFRLVGKIGQDPIPGGRFIVSNVVDGDTIELSGGDVVRLLSIDTPEKDEPYFDRAREFLSKLTLGQEVRVEFANVRRDRYGRLLGYVYVDSLFVNKAILENGLGYLYLFKDTDIDRPETRQLLAAQRSALNSHAGIWSMEYSPEPFYIAPDASYRFHRPGCRSIADLKPGRYRTFSTRLECLYEGLSPCRNCKP